MNCSKCNNVINEGQEVCLSCGHILGYEAEASKKCIHCNREIMMDRLDFKKKLKGVIDEKVQED